MILQVKIKLLYYSNPETLRETNQASNYIKFTLKLGTLSKLHFYHKHYPHTPATNYYPS